MDDEIYYTNPLSELAFRQGIKQELEKPTVQLYERRPKKVTVESSAELHVLDRAVDGCTKSELVAIVETYENDPAQTIDRLLESRLLVEEDDHVLDQVGKWFTWNARRALYYLMYSLGGEFELEYENKRDLHSMGGQESLDLPTPEELPSVPFRKVLLERRSHRDFDGAYISRQELAEILHYTVAPTRQTRSQVSEDSDPELSEYFSVAFLTSKLPLVVSRVKDVQPGVYYYDIQNHELVTYQQFEDATEADSKVADVANGQQFGNRVAVTFFPTVHYEDYRKFVGGPRSIYGVYQTASIITHRLMLVGTALEYQTWTSTAINESDTNEMLGLEWPELSALSLLSIGE